ncbi:MAG: PAS domain S-box protein [Verrucomicrobiota bacterium]|nr:PAS domain S-box protein [Verrucomicrobiota bacterium]
MRIAYSTDLMGGLLLMGIGVGVLLLLYRMRYSAQRENKLEQLIVERTAHLEQEIERRKQAQAELLRNTEELEKRVEARTEELLQTNKRLHLQLIERHKAEEALLQSEARFRGVIESGMVGILFWDMSGGITDANDAFLKMVGYTREEMKSGLMRWNEMTPPEYAHLDEKGLEEIKSHGICRPFEKEYIRKDGTRLPILIGAAKLPGISDGGVCFVVDITMQRMAQDEIRALNYSLEDRVSQRTSQLAAANKNLESEIIERKRIATELEAFSHLGQLLHSAENEKQAAQTILSVAQQLFGWDAAFLHLYHRASDEVIPVLIVDTIDGKRREVATPEDHFPPTAMMKKVLAEGAILLDQKSNQKKVELVPFGDTTRISVSAMYVPVRLADRVIGFLSAQRYAAPVYTHKDLGLFQALADYCANALHGIRAEKALRKSEESFRMLFECSPEIVYTMSVPGGIILSGNPAFEQITGWSVAEWIGKHFTELLHPSDIPRALARYREVVESDDSARPLVLRVKSKDGDFKYIEAISIVQRLEEAPLMFGFARDITARRNAEEALRELPHRILEAQEGERRRVSRELHDSVNQILASIKFRLQHMETQVASDEKFLSASTKTRSLLENALQEVRRISRNLRPSELDDFGLLSAVESLKDEFQERTGMKVSMETTGNVQRIEPFIELALYRIVQEALTNVEKHSGARTVSLAVAFADDYVTLHIQDDGKGFNQEEGPKRRRRGLGLLNIQERSEAADGHCSIKSTVGKGTEIAVHVPLHRKSGQEMSRET